MQKSSATGDLFVLLADSVYVGRDRICRIKPRGKHEAGILKQLLAIDGIEFKTGPDQMTGVYGNYQTVESISFKLGQNPHIDSIVQSMQDRLLGVDNMLIWIENQTERRNRISQAADKQTALDKLKAYILDFERGIRSSDGGSYYYFYFAPDKLDEAEKLFQQVGMAAIEPHKSRFGGKEQTVLRYPDTRLNGEELGVINALTSASHERRVSDDRQKDRASLEQGKQQIDAMSELKKVVTKIDRVKYGAESQELYYYFYSSNLDMAQKLFSQLGVKTEQYYSVSSKTTVLRVPRKNIAPYIVVELQEAIATRGIMPNTPQRGRFTI